MAHKVSTIVLKVDLACSRCDDKIRKVLCKYGRYQIQEEIIDEKNNTVTISGPFCPRKLTKKLCCKAGNAIKCIQIVDPPPDKTPPSPGKTPPDKTPPPPDKTSPPPVCCRPCYKGYGGGPCREGCRRPQSCHCGCGGSQSTCYDGCGRPPQPCHYGCGGSQSTCYNGCGRPPQPCHCGCGGSQSTCNNGCGRPPQPCYCGCGGSQSLCSRRYGRSSYGSV